jgi:hypothetical protein
VNFLSFYRPEFLWGLLFLGAAVLIHLLRRPRRRPLDFSTLRFFGTQTVKSARAKRLRKLLLLLSRLAAVGALIALFSQPFDRRDTLNAFRNPQLSIFIWIDRTPSMDYSEKHESLLSRARSLADTLCSILPSTVRHFWYDEGRDDFVPRDPAFPLPQRSRHGPPRLNKVLRAWNERREGCSLPVLLLVSDFQRSTSYLLDTLLRSLSLPARSAARIVCVSVAPRSFWNYAVRNAEFRDPGKVFATLAGQGNKTDSAGLSVFMSSIRIGRNVFSLRVDDTLNAEVAVSRNVLAAAGGRAELDVSDPLPFDNVSYFVSGGRNTLRVLIIGDRERNFPLAAALLASEHGRWKPVIVRESGAVTFDDIDSADVVIINAAGKPSRPLEALCTDQSLAGKSVLCALDDNENGFNACQALIATADRLKGPVRSETLATPVSVVLPDTISEIWQGFPALQIRESSISRYITGLPGTVLLRFDNGAPFVTRAAGRRSGSFLLIATPIGATQANNLCETGFFVPFIDRITRYAVSGHLTPSDIWTAGFERRNPFYGTEKGVTVLNEEGKFIERWQSRANVFFKQPGLYKIVPDGSEPFWVPVNGDPEESRLGCELPVIPDTIKDKILFLNEIELMSRLGSNAGILSFLPVLFLFLFLCAEILLWDNPKQRRL